MNKKTKLCTPVSLAQSKSMLLNRSIFTHTHTHIHMQIEEGQPFLFLSHIMSIFPHE